MVCQLGSHKILIMFIFFWGVVGCQDNDKVKVDFSQTTSSTRPAERNPGQPPLRVAVAAMISPRETFDLYHQLLSYLGDHLDRDLEFVQRKTYAEMNEMLGVGRIDLAFICSGPYVTGKEKYGFEALAAPEIRGDHYYQAYLIVNKNSKFESLTDLKNHSFAFTDPDSNTGKLTPDYWLYEMNERPETFFDRVIYTYSHDNSIMAVARNLVDAASVDGLVWEYYHAKGSPLTANTRVIKKSEPYGIPPLVASASLPINIREQIRHLLFSMHEDPKGKKVLMELMIDRFTPFHDEWYESIRHIYRKISQRTDKPGAFSQP